MAATYKLRINGSLIIDAGGLVYSYLITALTNGVPASVEVALVNNAGVWSTWSNVAIKTPTCFSNIIDNSGNNVIDDSANQTVGYVTP